MEAMTLAPHIKEAYQHMLRLAESVAELAPHRYRKETYTSVLGFLLAVQLNGHAPSPPAPKQEEQCSER